MEEEAGEWRKAREHILRLVRKIERKKNRKNERKKE